MHLLKNIEIIHIQHVHTPNLKPQKQKLAVPPNTDKLAYSTLDDTPCLSLSCASRCNFEYIMYNCFKHFYYSYIVLKIPSFNSLIDSCT